MIDTISRAKHLQKEIVGEIYRQQGLKTLNLEKLHSVIDEQLHILSVTHDAPKDKAELKKILSTGIKLQIQTAHATDVFVKDGLHAALKYLIEQPTVTNPTASPPHHSVPANPAGE
ncbi:hypothetical protein FJD38_00350 [Pseudomonas saxonica]|uniref:Uncharacterized protein n=1 Tax=Pseudomonas saxonica TaxID=2600598 RepID=A0ABY3GKA0_9PSED|nr:hypothetical protein [Pseudomonas saxonica]TWR92104.1 hypothetical protein FJD38_00350 [Pseudomonas saxonica]